MCFACLLIFFPVRDVQHIRVRSDANRHAKYSHKIIIPKILLWILLASENIYFVIEVSTNSFASSSMSANRIKKNSWRLFKKVKLDNKRVRKRAREKRARPRREKKSKLCLFMTLAEVYYR